MNKVIENGLVAVLYSPGMALDGVHGTMKMD